MKKSLILISLAASVVFAGAPAMSPVSEVMIAMRAAKAVKKQKEKAEQKDAQSEKLETLKTKYPADFAEYESLEKSDPYKADVKLKKMIVKYADDTGVDLDKKYDVKPSQGPVKRLASRLGGSKDDGNSSSSAQAQQPEKSQGLFRGYLRSGVNQVRGTVTQGENELKNSMSSPAE